jgi:hypothetical protein
MFMFRAASVRRIRRGRKSVARYALMSPAATFVPQPNTSGKGLAAVISSSLVECLSDVKSERLSFGLVRVCKRGIKRQGRKVHREERTGGSTLCDLCVYPLRPLRLNLY